MQAPIRRREPRSDNNQQGAIAPFKEYINENPECAAHVSDFVAAGLSKALDDAKQHALDMETLALSLSINKFSNKKEFIKKIIDKQEGRTCFNWDGIVGKNNE